LQAADRFLQEQPSLPKLTAPAVAWRYGFARYDEAAQEVRAFTEFPHYTGKAWQGGPNLPDPKLGWLMLNAAGGHPGVGSDQLVVRRWIAPESGRIRVSGVLTHASEKGDGVRARIAIDGRLVAGGWTVRNGQTEIELAGWPVEKGQAVDFAVDCRKTVEFDGFAWAPVVRLLTTTNADPGAETAQRQWDARKDFEGPKSPPDPLGVWEKYAQVLLISNEATFVD
jgi:hypothetical protein